MERSSVEAGVESREKTLGSRSATFSGEAAILVVDVEGGRGVEESAKDSAEVSSAKTATTFTKGNFLRGGDGTGRRFDSLEVFGSLCLGGREFGGGGWKDFGATIIAIGEVVGGT